jgi:hypothetical protein
MIVSAVPVSAGVDRVITTTPAITIAIVSWVPGIIPTAPAITITITISVAIVS